MSMTTQLRGSMRLQQASLRQRASAPRCSVVAAVSGPQRAAQLACTGVLAAALLLQPAVPSAQAQESTTLADVVREYYGYVDTNKDGTVSLDELRTEAMKVAQEQDFDMPTDELLQFSKDLYDLNMDGTTTIDEVLTTVAMQYGVGEFDIDAELVKVFNKGTIENVQVTLPQWKKALGPLGPGGEEVKEYVHRRVDFLGNQDGKLDTDELVQAMKMMKALTAGAQ